MAKKLLTDEEKRVFHDAELYLKRWEGLKNRYKKTDIDDTKRRAAIRQEIWNKIIIPLEAIWIGFGINNGEISQGRKEGKK